MNDVLGYDRRQFLNLGKVENLEFILGRPVDSVSDASAHKIFNYRSSARTS